MSAEGSIQAQSPSLCKKRDQSCPRVAERSISEVPPHPVSKLITFYLSAVALTTADKKPGEWKKGKDEPASCTEKET